MHPDEILGQVDASGEIWVRIDDFPNYFVSNYGNIQHQNAMDSRQLGINHQGFPVLTLWKEGDPSRYLRQVNLLVAKAFLPAPEHPSLNAIWHIDGNLLNCAADNLKWDRRDRVIAWNNMHRRGAPEYQTPKVQYNKTGEIFENAYEAGMATGELESSVIAHIERHPDQYADRARYRYV